MFDRGTLEVAKRADINVIDLDTLSILEPVHKHDLPTGAPRWDQAVRGYEYTLLNGVITFRNGTHTGALPGKLVRNQGQGVPTLKTGGALPLPGPPEWSTNAVRIAGWDLNTAEVSTAATALEASLESGSASSQSRVADALEAVQKSKL